ncbi:hypothetical protein [Vibrio phage VP16T]|nr:hypothetical protein [Vibrio phage VP16T]
MASNKELIEKIQALDPNHSLKDGKGNPLNNTGLSKELKRLNEEAAAKAAAESGTDGQDTQETPEPTPPAPQETPEPETKDGERVYKIVKGKSLVVQPVGVLDGGKQIKPEWLPGGEDQLAYLIGKGFVE